MPSVPMLLALFACQPLDGLDVESGLPGAESTMDASYRTTDGTIEVYFTEPGIARDEGEDPVLDDRVAALFDEAEHRIDLSLFEFDRQVIVDALLAAHDRGVEIRFAGDGDELHDDGYEQLVAAGIDLSLRKPYDRIMHNKFAVVDDRWVWTGSTNFSENGVMRNNNGSLLLDSAELADTYTAEFEQMYLDELFGRKKAPIDTTAPSLGGHDLELAFSPAQDPHEQLLDALDTADHTVFFMVFAFTRADISDKLIALHESGVQVVGIFDESQARGRYSVDEKLAEAGVPVYIDGNENAVGWAGGKLHHKTLIVDPLTDSDPTVSIGSYNWSKSASYYNDENMMVLHGAEVTAAYADQFCGLLAVAQPHPDYLGELPDPCAALMQTVRVNEVMPNPDGSDTGHEWVEIVNVGQAPVDLAGWQLGDGTAADRHRFDEVVLGPGQAVVVFDGPDNEAPGMIVASSGYLGLSNNADEVVLRDALGAVVDRVTWRNAASGVSFNRAEDGAMAGDFVLHTDLADGDSSPGWRVDGSAWGGDLVINEVMPNPAGSDAENEWVELVNSGDATLDVSGWTLEDEVGVQHTFGEGVTVRAGEAVLLWSGGSHAHVASSGSLSLNNSGDTLTLRDADGAVRDVVSWSGSDEDVSLVRAVDGDRDAALVSHDTLGGASSPGDRTDGSPWGALLVVNELMPNPEGYDTDNEWVELVNVGTATAVLEGWMLGDAVDPARHVFTDEELAPGEAMVIFDGGSHSEVPGHLVSSSGSLSLNNSGDLVSLHDASGRTVSAVTWKESTSGVSLTRAVDGDPSAALVPHDTLGGDSSPGTRADGSSF